MRAEGRQDDGEDTVAIGIFLILFELAVFVLKIPSVSALTAKSIGNYRTCTIGNVQQTDT
jgi:hypothetical protein